MLTRSALKNPYAVFALCMIALVLGAVSYKKCVSTFSRN